MEGEAGQTRLVMLEVPTAPVLSAGQFQHLHSQSHYRSEAVAYGHSWANPWIARAPTEGESIYDGLVLGNQQLFDRWFVSSICPLPGQTSVNSRLTQYLDSKLSVPLPNPRMKFFLRGGHRRPGLLADLTRILDEDDNVPTFRRVGASLMAEGAFNVHSTSVEAWKAMLGSLAGLKVPKQDLSGSVTMEQPEGSPLPRMTMVSDAANTGSWTGYRSLTDAELERLAQEVVREVKTRAPFVGLSDFVNRQYAEDDTGLKGTLQAAIDRTDINAAFTTELTLAKLQEIEQLGKDVDMDWAFPHPEHLVGPVGAGAPGFLTQADILQALAPHLATRSDTFKIRSYGDVVHPVTGKLEARAWLEAIVQRIPPYVNYPNRDEEGKVIEPVIFDPAWQTPSAAHNESNRVYGRTWRIVRLRWLSPEEV